MVPILPSILDPLVWLLKGCGACYSIAATFVLEARFRIAVQRDPSVKVGADAISLAPELGLCSGYNQACDGGFPFLVGRSYVEDGVRSEACAPFQTFRVPGKMVYSSLDQCYNSKIDSSCSVEPANPFFIKAAGVRQNFLLTGKNRQDGAGAPVPSRQRAATGPAKLSFAGATAQRSARPLDGSSFHALDYGYVGGFYGGCSEDAMLREIYHNGPVVVAADVDGLEDLSKGNVFRPHQKKNTTKENPLLVECHVNTSGRPFVAKRATRSAVP